MGLLVGCYCVFLYTEHAYIAFMCFLNTGTYGIYLYHLNKCRITGWVIERYLDVKMISVSSLTNVGIPYEKHICGFEIYRPKALLQMQVAFISNNKIISEIAKSLLLFSG